MVVVGMKNRGARVAGTVFQRLADVFRLMQTLRAPELDQQMVARIALAVVAEFEVVQLFVVHANPPVVSSSQRGNAKLATCSSGV